jgi:hypothetical protein
VPPEIVDSGLVDAVAVVEHGDARSAGGGGDLDADTGRLGVERVLDQLNNERADVVNGLIFQDELPKDRIDLGDRTDGTHGGFLEMD